MGLGAHTTPRDDWRTASDRELLDELWAAVRVGIELGAIAPQPATGEPDPCYPRVLACRLEELLAEIQTIRRECPSFTVHASDPLAVTLVEAWADLSVAAGVEPARIVAARETAAAMRRWIENHPGEVRARRDEIDG